jgi:hydroxymethylbilane synthase
MRIGTRGSDLALIQANRVKKTLESLDKTLSCEVVIVKTEGDLDLTTPLHQMGGKGAFVKKLEEALFREEIDIAVHSLKDITSSIPQGLVLGGFLAAEAVADALVLKKPCKSLAELPSGAILATGSMRRKALLKKLRPDIQTIDIRGNVLTRLEKLAKNDFHGLVLSEAGLVRLGLQEQISHCFSPKDFCPAPGQGVIAMQTREDDFEALPLCLKASDPAQLVKSTTELAFLQEVGFDCQTPLGLHARIERGGLHLRVFAANTAMEQFYENEFSSSLEDRVPLAKKASKEVLAWLEVHGW